MQIFNIKMQKKFKNTDFKWEVLKVNIFMAVVLAKQSVFAKCQILTWHQKDTCNICRNKDTWIWQCMKIMSAKLTIYEH